MQDNTGTQLQQPHPLGGSVSPEPPEATNPARLIFGPYWTGSGERFADPMMIRLRYQHACAGQFEQLLRDLQSADPDAKHRATEGLIKATWYAFEVDPFDPATGKGTTPSEAMALLRCFVGWCEDKKKVVDGSVTSAQPTVSGPSLSHPLTSKSSDCGCKAAGLRTVPRKR